MKSQEPKYQGRERKWKESDELITGDVVQLWQKKNIETVGEN